MASIVCQRSVPWGCFYGYCGHCHGGHHWIANGFYLVLSLQDVVRTCVCVYVQDTPAIMFIFQFIKKIQSCEFFHTIIPIPVKTVASCRRYSDGTERRHIITALASLSCRVESASVSASFLHAPLHFDPPVKRV